jgi:hypothetical protein
MYTMSFKTGTWTILVQLFIIVILALWLSTTPIAPINASGREGFFQMSPYALEYTNVSQPNQATDDLYALRNIKPDNSQCKKVSGFPGYGVFCTPYTESEKVDIYSEAKGDLKCQDLGLYNSMGPLCLDANMKRMLQTRGMNAEGGFGQIGSA